MDGYKVVFIIPAFNEESTIFNVVQSVQKYGDVIVVNDFSNDRTEEVAESAGAIVIAHLVNQGYNEALNSGLKRAVELEYDAAITFDADGQHTSDAAAVFVDKLKNGADLVLGVRPRTQRFSELVFKMYTKYRFRWEDPLCGMKGYNLSFMSIVDDMFTYNSIGTEIALNFLKAQCVFVQVPISIRERQDKPRFGNVLMSNILILRALLISMIKVR